MSEQAVRLPTTENIIEYELLKDMLYSQKNEFDLLSKKKADGQLNSMKIKMANRVLEPLKELFKHEEAHKFLDILNEDEMPTNSDVVLIISQYKTAIKEFHSNYYVKDEHLKYSRWMTQECPFDYYESEENDEEE